MKLTTVEVKLVEKFQQNSNTVQLECQKKCIHVITNRAMSINCN